MQLVRDLFAGGESRRMGLNSIAVRIEDSSVSQHLPDTFQSLQSGNHNVSVRVFQSFQAGQLLSKEGMDAVLQLFINRDQQMCEAYAQVNEKKPTIRKLLCQVRLVVHPHARTIFGFHASGPVSFILHSKTIVREGVPMHYSSALGTKERMDSYYN